MKFVVPLTIPWMRSMGVAESDSSSTRTTGTTPATAASTRSRTPRSRAVSNSSSPCCESSCLFALTTSLPACSALSRYSRAGSMPPISSTSRSAPARICSKSPWVRVSSPLRTGRRPLKRSISSALCSNSTTNADPTVPCPSRPTRKSPLPGSRALARAPPGALRALADIARGQVLEALSPHHLAGVAFAGEDDRRARRAIVVVGHRISVRSGRGRDDHVSRPRVVEQRLARDHVSGLAVLAREHARRCTLEAVRDVRLVWRAVEHRAQVVRHAAVHRHPARDVLLDALHRVQGHLRVGAQRPARLDQQAVLAALAVRAGGVHDLLHVALDRRRRRLRARVANPQAPAEVPDRELAQLRELLRGPRKRLQREQLRADVRVHAAQSQPAM